MIGLKLLEQNVPQHYSTCADAERERGFISGRSALENGPGFEHFGNLHAPGSMKRFSVKHP
jgi:hypothetical protein